MGTSNIEIVMNFLVTLSVILIVVLAVYWIWILATTRWTRVKTRKVRINRHVREFKAEVGRIFLSAFVEVISDLIDEARCYRCGALSPTHYYGCPYAAQWCIETIAKPGG